MRILNTGSYFCVVDPDPTGAETFSKIRILEK